MSTNFRSRYCQLFLLVFFTIFASTSFANEGDTSDDDDNSVVSVKVEGSDKGSPKQIPDRSGYDIDDDPWCSSMFSREQYGNSYDPMARLSAVLLEQDDKAVEILQAVAHTPIEGCSKGPNVDFNLFYRAALLALYYDYLDHGDKNQYEQKTAEFTKSLSSLLSQSSGKANLNLVTKARFISGMKGGRILSNGLMAKTISFMIVNAYDKSQLPNGNGRLSSFEKGLIKYYSEVLLQQIVDADKTLINLESLLKHCIAEKLLKNEVMYPPVHKKMVGHFIDAFGYTITENYQFESKVLVKQLLTELKRKGDITDCNLTHVISRDFTFTQAIAALFGDRDSKQIAFTQQIKKDEGFARLLFQTFRQSALECFERDKHKNKNPEESDGDMSNDEEYGLEQMQKMLTACFRTVAESTPFAPIKVELLLATRGALNISKPDCVFVQIDPTRFKQLMELE